MDEFCSEFCIIHGDLGEIREICMITKLRECHKFGQFCQWVQRTVGNWHRLHKFHVIRGVGGQIEQILRNLL